jgi:hypothetical protein
VGAGNTAAWPAILNAMGALFSAAPSAICRGPTLGRVLGAYAALRDRDGGF